MLILIMKNIANNTMDIVQELCPQEVYVFSIIIES